MTNERGRLHFSTATSIIRAALGHSLFQPGTDLELSLNFLEWPRGRDSRSCNFVLPSISATYRYPLNARNLHFFNLFTSFNLFNNLCRFREKLDTGVLPCALNYGTIWAESAVCRKVLFIFMVFRQGYLRLVKRRQALAKTVSDAKNVCRADMMFSRGREDSRIQTDQQCGIDF